MEQSGWKLVPVEPVIGMLRALTAKWGDKGAEFTARWALGSFREDYRAMLAAAPQPPAPADDVDWAERAIAAEVALAEVRAEWSMAGKALDAAFAPDMDVLELRLLTVPERITVLAGRLTAERDRLAEAARRARQRLVEIANNQAFQPALHAKVGIFELNDALSSLFACAALAQPKPEKEGRS